MKNEIETIFNLKGILKEKIYINRFNIIGYSGLLHLLLTILLTVIIISNSPIIKISHIFIPLWGMTAYIIYKNENINKILYYIITFPIQIIIHLITSIFIIKYQKRYPNVDIDKNNIERYLKVKKLNKICK